MHNPPVGIISNLEVEPGVSPGGVIKIPGVNGVWTLDQLRFLVPAPIVGHDIVERFLHCRQQLPYPSVIAGCLPCKVDRFDEPVFDVGFHGNAHVLRPVFLFARNLFGRHGEVVKYPSAGRLNLGKVVNEALHVFFPVPEPAHHIGIIPYPQTRCIRRSITANVRAEHGILGDIFHQESLNPRVKSINLCVA